MTGPVGHFDSVVPEPIRADVERRWDRSVGMGLLGRVSGADHLGLAALLLARFSTVLLVLGVAPTEYWRFLTPSVSRYSMDSPPEHTISALILADRSIRSAVFSAGVILGGTRSTVRNICQFHRRSDTTATLGLHRGPQTEAVEYSVSTQQRIYHLQGWCHDWPTPSYRTTVRWSVTALWRMSSKYECKSHLTPEQTTPIKSSIKY